MATIFQDLSIPLPQNHKTQHGLGEFAVSPVLLGRKTVVLDPRRLAWAGVLLSHPGCSPSRESTAVTLPFWLQELTVIWKLLRWPFPGYS